MNGFMQRLAGSPYIIPLLAAAILSTRSYRQKWPVAYRFFSVYLILMLLIEMIAIEWSYTLHKTRFWNYSDRNLWIYNSFLPVSLYAYLYFFGHFIKQRWYAIIAFVIAAMYTALFVYECVYKGYFFSMPPLSITLVNIIAVLLISCFFYSLLKGPQVIKFSKIPAVWIACGIFIFYLGTLPVFLQLTNLVAISTALADNVVWLITSFNFISYSFFIIAFSCPKPTHT